VNCAISRLAEALGLDGDNECTNLEILDQAVARILSQEEAAK
jgi:hypothetical protein